MRKLSILSIVSAMILAFSAVAFGHTLSREAAQQYATSYAQTVVDDNDDDIYDFDLDRCRTVSLHRRDCGGTFYYGDDHADGACDVTLVVRFYSSRSHRIKVYDQGDWDCDAET